MTWTPSRIDLAASLWADGWSSSQIARKLGVERGAVAGFANRNRDRFPARPAPQKKAKAERKPVARKRAAPKPAKAPPVKPSKPAPLSAAALHIVGQRFEKIKDFGACKFPLDRDSVNDEHMLCCGLPAEIRIDARGYVRSSSWCPAHASVVFQRGR